MESCAMGQPRPRKRGKKSVDSCPSFSDSKTKSVRAKIKIDKKDPPPIKIKETGGHMNVRDLGSDPGVVKPSYEMSAEGQKRSSYKGEYGDDVARAAEIGMARRRKKK